MEIKDLPKLNKCTVSIIGLGYVGLPLAIELAKIKKIIDKKVPDAIVESLLVLDASQGQNGLKQAKSFAKSANLSGAIITKLDGTSRGGVSLAVSEEVNLPIRFIGAGEGIKDLRPFNSYEFVEAMLADK